METLLVEKPHWKQGHKILFKLERPRDVMQGFTGGTTDVLGPILTLDFSRISIPWFSWLPHHCLRRKTTDFGPAVILQVMDLGQ